MQKYPPYPISLAFRRTLMIVLILSFFVLSGVLIFSTSGYQYDFQQRAVLSTGVLSIDIHTEHTRAYLEGLELSTKEPLRKTDLTPGIYQVRVEKSGHHVFEHTVKIQANKTTYVTEIDLLKNRLPIAQLYSTTEVEPTTISPTGHYAVFKSPVKNDGTYRWSLLDTRTDERKTIASLPQIVEPTIEWSDSADMFIFSYLDPETNTTSVQVVYPDSEILTQRYSGIQLKENQWKRSDTALYSKVGNWIEKFSPSGQKLLLQTSSSVWTVTADDTVWVANESGSQILSSKNNIIDIGIPDTVVRRIIEITDTYVLFENQNEMLVVLSRTGDEETVIFPGKKLSYIPETQSWLIVSDWELWELNALGKTTLLHRAADKLIAAIPLLENGELLLWTERGLTAFHPRYYTRTELFQDASLHTVAVDKSQRTIFFLGDVGRSSGLYSLIY